MRLAILVKYLIGLTIESLIKLEIIIHKNKTKRLIAAMMIDSLLVKSSTCPKPKNNLK